MLLSEFVRTVAAEAIAGIVAGVVVLGLGYLVVDKKLSLREALDRQRDHEVQRVINLRAVLGAVHGELEGAATQLTTGLTEIPSGGVMFPLFDCSMWPLVAEPAIFTTLGKPTVQALTHAYNRMRTANEQNELLADLNHGPTAILTAAIAAGSIENDLVKETYERFQHHRDVIVRTGVVERLQDLKPYLDQAIDAVEAELGVSPPVPASQRLYQPEVPTGFIGDPLDP